MNKELLNVCYRFFNRFIVADELVEELEKLNNNDEIDKMIKDIKKIMKENPNKDDDYAKRRRKSIEEYIKKFEVIPDNEEVGDFFSNRVKGLKEELNKEVDSQDRWFNIVKYINENKYFNENFEGMSKYELLEFIAQYIQAPFPPQITSEEFDELVQVGIEKDEREWLWRLAFNYEHFDVNFDKIVDYYIKVKDGYYINELISAIGDRLDVDKIIDSINDRELIDQFKEHKDIVKNYLSEEQLERLLNK